MSTEVGTIPRYDAARIKDMRKRLGLTQVQFAARVPVAQATISQWEAGLTTPRGLAIIESLMALEREAA